MAPKQFFAAGAVLPSPFPASFVSPSATPHKLSQHGSAAGCLSYRTRNQICRRKTARLKRVVSGPCFQLCCCYREAGPRRIQRDGDGIQCPDTCTLSRANQPCCWSSRWGCAGPRRGDFGATAALFESQVHCAGDHNIRCGFSKCEKTPRYSCRQADNANLLTRCLVDLRKRYCRFKQPSSFCHR